MLLSCQAYSSSQHWNHGGGLLVRTAGPVLVCAASTTPATSRAYSGPAQRVTDKRRDHRGAAPPRATLPAVRLAEYRRRVAVQSSAVGQAPAETSETVERLTGLTPEKRGRFLALLRDGHTVKHAAAAIRLSRQALYVHRADEAGFKADWDAAVEEGTEALEQEARRRAVDGTLKPVYYQGAKVGTVREYSDTLLIFLLKGRKPAVYRDNVKHTVGGEDGGPVPIVIRTITAKIPPGVVDDDGHAAAAAEALDG
jgi:hypothetical protein